jgi:hypothetical protein
MPILTSPNELRSLLQRTQRIAVLGIKTEAQAGQPAYDVPAYLARVGYDIVPVPVYYPDVTRILDKPVVRDLRAITPAPDMVNVFRRPSDLAAHLEALVALRPASVWLQLGIHDDAFVAALDDAGVAVVSNRCIMVDHRMLMG